MAAVAVAVAALMVTASGNLSNLTALDSARVLDGELWRILTGHLAHLTWRHYAVDAPAFVLLYATYARRTASSRALLLALAAALTVSLSVILAGMHEVYGGLSGLTCAGFSALVVGMIREQPRHPLPYLAGIVFLLYLVTAGGTASGVRVAQEAHLAGALTGAIFARGEKLRLVAHAQVTKATSRLASRSQILLRNVRQILGA